MNDQEKSILLAKAMEWDVGLMDETIFPTGEDISVFIDTGDGESLYDPANMALAWRVLNWAQQQECFDAGRHDLTGFTFNLTLIDSWIGRMIGQKNMGRLDSPSLFDLPPADAQRLWLDKILFLVIEAGLVEVRDENI